MAIAATRRKCLLVSAGVGVASCLLMPFVAAFVHSSAIVAFFLLLPLMPALVLGSVLAVPEGALLLYPFTFVVQFFATYALCALALFIKRDTDRIKDKEANG